MDCLLPYLLSGRPLYKQVVISGSGCGDKHAFSLGICVSWV